MKVTLTALALFSLPFVALAQEQPTQDTPQNTETTAEQATAGDTNAPAGDAAAPVSLAGVTADPAVVQQILAEAGPNPSADAIAAVGNRLASAAGGDPSPILAAALVAGQQAGVAPTGLVAISRSMVTSHAATPAASNNTVATMAAVTHAALPANIAGRAVSQVIAAAVAANPTLSRGDITSTAAAAIANTRTTGGESIGATGSTGGEGSPRTNSPVVTAANLPSGSGASGGGGNNQPFIAPSASPTPASPYGN